MHGIARGVTGTVPKRQRTGAVQDANRPMDASDVFAPKLVTMPFMVTSYHKMLWKKTRWSRIRRFYRAVNKGDYERSENFTISEEIGTGKII